MYLQSAVATPLEFCFGQVLIQTISSHCRKPQCLRSSRPLSIYSPDPTHMKINDWVSASSLIGKALIHSKLHGSSLFSIFSSSLKSLVGSTRSRYSGNGKSIKIVSNFPNEVKSNSLWSTVKCISGWLLPWFTCAFRTNKLLIFASLRIYLIVPSFWESLNNKSVGVLPSNHSFWLLFHMKSWGRLLGCNQSHSAHSKYLLNSGM